jgi:hypothetical protein
VLAHPAWQQQKHLGWCIQLLRQRSCRLDAAAAVLQWQL